MDKIIIKDLEIYAYHGVNPEENKLGQKFFLSIELCLDLSDVTDNINKTISYAEVCKFIEHIFTKENFRLIESCGDYVARQTLLRFKLAQSVKVKIKKPWAPIGSHLNHVAVEITRSWHDAYLGIGSNIGNKEKNLNGALKLLKAQHTEIIKVSSFTLTKPVGYPDQDDFLNGAVMIRTLLTPKELLEHIQKTEKILKRERNIKWGPRTIDVDILIYDDLVTYDKSLIIPHPYMEKRLFVLAPLCEIEPYLIHPLTGKRIFDLKEYLEKENNLITAD